ncbi:cytochrome c [Rhodobacteraceae bacterium DSL-40]|uniref:c-type cytochrome n=1 Tax=Amaricoccus sp. B4 TaxID=3368557 RepID=UPI000DAD485D
MLLLRIAVGLGLLGVIAAVAGWFASAPRGLSAAEIAALPEGDAARGEAVFWAGGCASCHAAPDAKGDDKLSLGGGRVLASDFGDFVAPNISMDREDGIGSWSEADFANAMLRGVSPEGEHFYPSFPYTSFTRMNHGDIADLWAFWQTLPAVEGKAPGHRLAFPFNIRRGIGLWKLAFLSDAPVIAIDTSDPKLVRGRYLVEGPGHCGECHTSRDIAGGLDYGLWLAGAPNPDGRGRIPNITGGEGGIGSWSESDIAYYLESGFTPDFDSVGGSMVAVQENMAKLESWDRESIAAYLKAVPAHATAP